MFKIFKIFAPNISVYIFFPFIRLNIYHFIFFMQAVKIPPKSKCIEIFGTNDGEKVHFSLLEAEFRNAKLLKEQIEMIRREVSIASVNNICSLLSISRRQYYNALNDKPVFDPLTRSPPSQQLLTNIEEDSIIQEIFNHQVDNNCLSGQDIRNLAEEIYKQRTGITKLFTRDWCRDFSRRHSESIEKVKTDSLDDKRASIDPIKVEEYISEVENALQNPPPPSLILNFDETGFSRRPEKGKRKTVFVSKNCNVPPHWREKTELHHVSLVTCITAACTALKPLVLSTRQHMDKDIDDTFFSSWALYYKTPKGYMTCNSMEFWLRNIVAPYVKSVRDEMKSNQKCIIIGDGCSSHFSEGVSEILDEIGNIKILPIPPHSSHFTQMLDATVFGSIKRKYTSIKNDISSKSKFTKKLIRIKRAYESVLSQELIQSGWEATGFHLSLKDGKVIDVTFKEEFKEILRSECRNSQNPE